MTLNNKIKWLKDRMNKLKKTYHQYGYIQDFNIRNRSIAKLNKYWIQRIHPNL